MPDISVLALMVQDADQPAGAGEVQTDFFKLLGEGGTIAQVVLVILLIPGGLTSLIPKLGGRQRRSAVPVTVKEVQPA